MQVLRLRTNVIVSRRKPFPFFQSDRINGFDQLARTTSDSLLAILEITMTNCSRIKSMRLLGISATKVRWKPSVVSSTSRVPHSVCQEGFGPCC